MYVLKCRTSKTLSFKWLIMLVEIYWNLKNSFSHLDLNNLNFSLNIAYFPNSPSEISGVSYVIIVSLLNKVNIWEYLCLPVPCFQCFSPFPNFCFVLLFFFKFWSFGWSFVINLPPPFIFFFVGLQLIAVWAFSLPISSLFLPGLRT